MDVNPFLIITAGIILIASLIPFDPIRHGQMAHDEMVAGMRKYNRRKAREKERAAEKSPGR